MNLLEFCQWLENTSLGVEIREGQSWFSLLNGVHLVGMAVAFGTIAIVDLRLLGKGIRRARVSEVASSLLPWTWAGFAVMAASGTLLVFSEAVKLYGNVFFWTKVTLLIAAGLNVLIFHRTVYKRVAEWDLEPVPPRQARVTGMISLACWFGLMAAGRAIPYLDQKL
jgi:hypothetical protein